tara:strand:- start:909 stop:1100 length:192 start_codon:yes stop_codon:yes gene_type:complete
MVKYAVWLEIDKGEFDYVRTTNEGSNSWTETSPIKIFNTKEEAQQESNKWNTGKVVEYEEKRL